MNNFNFKTDLVPKNIESAIKIVLIFFIIYICFLIFKPFLLPIIWATIIAVAIYPLHLKLSKLLRNKTSLSAILITLIALSILIIPSFYFMGALISSLKELALQFKSGTFTIPTPPPKVTEWPVIGKPINDIWLSFSTNTTAAIKQFQPEIKTAGESLLSSVSSLVSSLLVFVFAIIIAGAFLANSKSLYNIMKNVFQQLVGENGNKMLDNSKATISSVVNGVLGVALIQSVLVAIGFFIADVPGAPILSLMVLFLAIIQVPPTLLIIPVVIYMYPTMPTTGGIIFIIWNVIASLSDNFLKPILLGRGLEIPMLIILIGSIGGMLLMGIIGLFIGAVILALGYQLFQLWVGNEQEAEKEKLS